jgi:hypothetical protein
MELEALRTFNAFPIDTTPLFRTMRLPVPPTVLDVPPTIKLPLVLNEALSTVSVPVAPLTLANRVSPLQATDAPF